MMRVMMAWTEQDQIGQVRPPAVEPVHDVVCLEPGTQATTRVRAAPVAEQQRAELPVADEPVLPPHVEHVACFAG